MLLELIKRKILLKYLNLKDVHILSKLSKGFHKLLIKKDWLPNLFTYGLRSTGLYDLTINREEFFLCCKYGSFDRAINILEKQESYGEEQPYNRDNVIIRGFRELCKHKDTSKIMHKLLLRSDFKVNCAILEEAVTLVSTEVFLQLFDGADLTPMLRGSLKYLCDFYEKEDLKGYFVEDKYILLYEQCKFGHLKKDDIIYDQKCFSIIIGRNRYELVDNIGTNYPIDTDHFERMCMNNAYQLIERILEKNFDSCKDFISGGFVISCAYSSFESVKILIEYVNLHTINDGIIRAIPTSFVILEYLFDFIDEYSAKYEAYKKSLSKGIQESMSDTIIGVDIDNIIYVTFSNSRDIRTVLYIVNRFNNYVTYLPGFVIMLDAEILRYVLRSLKNITEKFEREMVRECLEIKDLDKARVCLDTLAVGVEEFIEEAYEYVRGFGIVLSLIIDYKMEDKCASVFLEACCIGDLIDGRIGKFKHVIGIRLVMGLKKLQEYNTEEAKKSIAILEKVLNSGN